MVLSVPTPQLSGMALTLPAVIAGLLLASCAPRNDLPYHVVHNPDSDGPRNIFVDPVGQGYPALVQRSYPSSEPLPTVRRPFFGQPAGDTSTQPVPVDPSLPGAWRTKPRDDLAPAPATPPVTPPAVPKQTTLKPTRDRIVRSSPAPAASEVAVPVTPPQLPIVAPAPITNAEVVAPLPATAEARASTQLRR